MKNKEDFQYGNGIGFGTLLFLTFLILKLTKVISWSWIWVFSPLWLPFVAIMVILGIVGLITAIFKN